MLTSVAGFTREKFQLKYQPGMQKLGTQILRKQLEHYEGAGTYSKQENFGEPKLYFQKQNNSGM